MGLFSHHDSEPETAEFMGLTLDAQALNTPAGSIPIGELTRAVFHRDIVSDGRGPDQMSVPAVAGGAVVGGVVAGPIGAVAGGLVGSTVKEVGPEQLRTTATSLIFESKDINYTMAVTREQESEAIRFAETVQKAMKHHKG